MNFNDNINSLRFHSNHCHLFIATTKGFAVLDVSKFQNIIKLTDRRKLINKGISLVAQLGTTDRFGLVGGPIQPYENGCFVGWDDRHSEHEFANLKSLNDKITEMKIEGEKLYLGVVDKIFIYQFPTMKEFLEVSFYNSENERGSFDIRVEDKREIFSYLYSKNSFRVYDLVSQQNQILNTSLGISLIKINDQTTKIATVCEKGQNILVYDIDKFPIKDEPTLTFFRGEKHAQVYSLSFSLDSTLLAVTSSTGTLHIFDISPKETSKNQESYIKSIPFISYLPIISSHTKKIWSFGKIDLFEHFGKTSNFSELKPICEFSNDNQLLVTGLDGSFLRFHYQIANNTFTSSLKEKFNVMDILNK